MLHLAVLELVLTFFHLPTTTFHLQNKKIKMKITALIFLKLPGNKKTKAKKTKKNQSTTRAPAVKKPAKKRTTTKKPVPSTTVAPVTVVEGLKVNVTEELTTVKNKTESSEENDVFDDLGDVIDETISDGPDDDDSEESDED